jgi:hypothetical protein
MTEFHLPKFGDLPQHQFDFLSARRERVTAMLPAYEDLRKQLLAFGGLEVVLPRYDQFSEAEQRRQAYDVPQVLARGETWPGSSAVLEIAMENNCHNNVAQIRSSGRGSIVSGWALADDGLWREHSWLILRSANSKHSVLETTQAWLLYHGYQLDARETGWFIHSELGPDAPVPGAA